tara:strand:- start:1419 stop:1619 length:201 start_codon:yes stop_codon:yes gene_type:complete
MIEWLTTEITAPEAGREIVAKNPNKEISSDSSVKQCRSIKFHKSFSEDMIIETMLSDGFTLWSYTE